MVIKMEQIRAISKVSGSNSNKVINGLSIGFLLHHQTGGAVTTIPGPPLPWPWMNEEDMDTIEAAYLRRVLIRPLRAAWPAIALQILIGI